MIHTQTELPPSAHPWDTALQERHKLRAQAAELLDSERLKSCGRQPTGATVELWRSGEGGAHFRGVETCGSIWACPVCSVKIAQRRAGEVQELADAHEKAQGAVYMATFTLRHHAFDEVKKLRLTVAKAWQKMQAGAPWKRLKAAYGIAHTVRALEVTHGRNGWHPHIHVLLLTTGELDATESEMMRLDLYERWARMVERLGGDTEEGAFDLRRASTGKEAALYVAKWGAGHEIAKGARKSAAGRSVWDLLKASEFDETAARLFTEYARAFHGARHLTYSRGSREAYGLRAAAPDEDLALEGACEDETIDPETGEVITKEEGRIYIFDRASWRRVCQRGLTGAVLEACRDGGREAVERLLAQHDTGSYYDAADYPAPNYKPPPEPRGRAFDPGGCFDNWGDFARAKGA